MKFNKGLRYFLVAMTLSLCVSVFAEKSELCQKEIQSICPGKEMGKGLGKCLKENKDKFSKECRAKAQGGKKEMKALMRVCKKDVKSLCKGVERGHGGIIKCLKDNEENVSKDCQARLSNLHKSDTDNLN